MLSDTALSDPQKGAQLFRLIKQPKIKCGTQKGSLGGWPLLSSPPIVCLGLRWVNLNNLPNVACRVKGHADMFLIKFTQTAVSHQDDLMALIPAKYYIYLKAKHLPGQPSLLLTCGRRPEGRRHARIRHIRQPEPAANPSRTRAPHVSCWCRPRSPGRRRAYWNV